jgi:hypothetical protein
MARRCPPGVFCFENISFFIVIIVIIVCVFFMMRYFGGGGGGGSQYHGHGYGHGSNITLIQQPLQPPAQSDFLDFGIGGPPSNQDVLLNPYVPPLRDNSVGSTTPMYDIRGGVETIHYGGYGFGGGGGGGGGVRVNVPTRAVDTTYRQVGILTRNSGTSGGGQETILPLIGRPLFTNRDKWQFYTLSDKNNAIKLPITVNGKSGTGEYGCNNVSTGDMVYVEGYNDAFKASTYDSASLRYLPF